MPEGNNTVPESGTQGQNTPGAANGASLSFDDILADRGYQSEFDKRVAKAIETAKTKWQASADADKSKAVNDAVAGLSARLIRAEITAELVKAKARDADVVLPLIDTAKLKQTDTGLEGLAEQIKAIKESKAYAVILTVLLAFSLIACESKVPDSGTNTTPSATRQEDRRDSASPDLSETEPPAGAKVLVAYFSRTGENYGVGVIDKGNTEIIAEMIAAKTGGDLFRIESVNAYPSGYDTAPRWQGKRKMRMPARS